MSSIDKGVENIVNSMGRNVKVTNSGGYIVGRINGEVVFTIRDRYGYINTDEASIVRNGIEQYDENVRRRAIEAREAELRRARELREAEERRRKEEARTAALNDLRNNLNKKITALNNQMTKDLNAANNVYSEYERLQTKVSALRRTAGMFKVNSLCQEIISRAENTKNLCNSIRNEYSHISSQYQSIANRIRNDQTQQASENMFKEVNRINNKVTQKVPSLYDVNKYETTIDCISSELLKLKTIVEDLKANCSMEGRNGYVANSILQSITDIEISKASDVIQISSMVEKAIIDIKSNIEKENTTKSVEELRKLEGQLISCQKVNEIITTTTYVAHDYRNDIEELAEEVVSNYNKLLRKEFTTCSNSKIEAIIDACKTVLTSDLSDESTLLQLQKLNNDFYVYDQNDTLHERSYQEYLEYKNKLIEYGIGLEDIPAFDVNNYTIVKEQISQMISIQKREQEKALMHIASLDATSVMEEMGYRLFAKVSDPRSYITEILFAKPGYDGVLWQIIVTADGKLSRALIGVDEGETQTDIEYVKEVANEMEQNGEVEEFLQKFSARSGSEELYVHTAIEANSENADAAIHKIGYHYLRNEEAKRAYRLCVAKLVNNEPVKIRKRQVKAVNKVRTTDYNIRQEQQQCMERCSAN